MTAPKAVTSRVSLRTQVTTLLRDDLVWDVADRLDALAAAEMDPTLGGRPRAYPLVCAVIWDGLVSIFGSSRQVDVELACPDSGWWDLIRSHASRRGIEVPAAPMRRYHYAYLRDRYLTHDDQLELLTAVFNRHAALQAVQIGLCDRDGAGSLTHPHPDRVVAGDGKVLTPRYKTHPRNRRHVNQCTGEVRYRKVDPDAGNHVTGGGDHAFGTKYVLTSTRGDARNQRIILDIAHSPATKGTGGEAATAITALDRVLPLLPGTQAVVYDGALRGTHLHHLITCHGIIPIAKVHKAAGGDMPDHHLPWAPRNGAVPSTTPFQLHTVNGAPHARTLAVDGTPILHPLTRTKLVRRRDKNGWRLYGEYRLPDHLDATAIRLRLDQSAEDRLSGFNREEHLRAIPPDDPDHPALYGRRNDTESGNRLLDDSMLRERAHTVGRHRQLLNLLTWAAGRNAIAVHHHARQPSTAAPPGLAA